VHIVTVRTKVIKVTLSDEEYKEVLRVAQREPLGSFARRVILAECARIETMGSEPRRERGMTEKRPEAREVTPYSGSAEMPTDPKPKKFGTAFGDPLPEGAEIVEVTEAVMPEAAPKPKKKVKSCVHGTEQGNNCWQCGGVAKISSP
jgi:hypothetical protein